MAGAARSVTWDSPRVDASRRYCPYRGGGYRGIARPRAFRDGRRRSALELHTFILHHDPAQESARQMEGAIDFRETLHIRQRRVDARHGRAHDDPVDGTTRADVVYGGPVVAVHGRIPDLVRAETACVRPVTDRDDADRCGEHAACADLPGTCSPVRRRGRAIAAAVVRRDGGTVCCPFHPDRVGCRCRRHPVVCVCRFDTGRGNDFIFSSTSEDLCSEPGWLRTSSTSPIRTFTRASNPGSAFACSTTALSRMRSGTGLM
ncbi:hypothetical protein KY49_2187 [Burkholderia sp. MSHR3999]|nr:hypothetical protein KY49_2187 [Burkholderia sp. MSHR3999]